MRRCYRTPGQILTAAHAMGMGLLRPEGMLTGITNKEDWHRIGYEVKGDFRRVGKPITITRKPEFSPNPIPELWGEPVLEFETFSSREAEMTALSVLTDYFYFISLCSLCLEWFVILYFLVFIRNKFRPDPT
jgi:superfamily I DNA and RNA helicase